MAVIVPLVFPAPIQRRDEAWRPRGRKLLAGEVRAGWALVKNFWDWFLLLFTVAFTVIGMMLEYFWG